MVVVVTRGNIAGYSMVSQVSQYDGQETFQNKNVFIVVVDDDDWLRAQ